MQFTLSNIEYTVIAIPVLFMASPLEPSFQARFRFSSSMCSQRKRNIQQSHNWQCCCTRMMELMVRVLKLLWGFHHLSFTFCAVPAIKFVAYTWMDFLLKFTPIVQASSNPASSILHFPLLFHDVVLLFLAPLFLLDHHHPSWYLFGCST